MILRAFPTSCATDVSDFLLEDVIIPPGAPRQLLTDRGRYFLSQVLQDILHSCATKHYHIKTNDLAGWLNRTITEILAMYASSDNRDWDAALAFVTFAYNTSQHDTAGFSPLYILCGRERTLPLDTLIPAVSPTTSEYARDVITKIIIPRGWEQFVLSANVKDSKRAAMTNRGGLCLFYTCTCPCRLLFRKKLQHDVASCMASLSEQTRRFFICSLFSFLFIYLFTYLFVALLYIYKPL